jgi:hypothetical protein
LGWSAGARIAVTPMLGAVVVRTTATGTEAITTQGHLRLRASIRRAAQIHSAERLLLVAYLRRGLLVAYTMDHLEAMLQTSPVTVMAGALP